MLQHLFYDGFYTGSKLHCLMTKPQVCVCVNDLPSVEPTNPLLQVQLVVPLRLLAYCYYNAKRRIGLYIISLYLLKSQQQPLGLASFSRVRLSPPLWDEEYNNPRFYHICAEFGRQDLSNITEIVALNARLNYQLTIRMTKFNFLLEFQPIPWSIPLANVRGVFSLFF